MDFPSPPPSPGRSRPDCKRDTEQVFSKDPKGLPCSPQFVQIGLVSGGPHGSSVSIKSAVKPLPLCRGSQRPPWPWPWPWPCWDGGGPQGGASVESVQQPRASSPLAVPGRLLNHRCSRSFGSAQTGSYSFGPLWHCHFPSVALSGHAWGGAESRGAPRGDPSRKSNNIHSSEAVRGRPNC